jgi:anti-sigma-K factor RskA
MAADELKRIHPTAAAGAAEDLAPAVATQTNGASPWYARARFWRAVAGMALAIAIACIIVTLETSSELSYRSATYRRRVHQLSLSLQRMRGQIATADQQLATMRGSVLVRDNLNRILAASDVRLLRLQPVDSGTKTIATIAVSRKLSRAVLEVEGLPPAPPGQIYRWWWTLERGTMVAAAEFQTTIDSRAMVPAQLPPGQDAVAGAVVTAESGSAAEKPRGAVKLKSAPPKASARR